MSCGTVITSFPMALHELPIVLASASERRRSILNTMGWKRVRQCPCAVYQEALDPKTFATAADYAKENARQKGSEIAERFGYLRERAQSQNDFHDHAVCPVVIAADTVVSFFDQIIEKPKDREDAIKIIKLLSGYEDAVSYQRPVSRRTHNVVTGVALYYNKVLLELFSVETKVIFAPLTLKDINVRRWATVQCIDFCSRCRNMLITTSTWIRLEAMEFSRLARV